jgi:hypothetical protein
LNSESTPTILEQMRGNIVLFTRLIKKRGPHPSQARGRRLLWNNCPGQSRDCFASLKAGIPKHRSCVSLPSVPGDSQSHWRGSLVSFLGGTSNMCRKCVQMYRRKGHLKANCFLGKAETSTGHLSLSLMTMLRDEVEPSRRRTLSLQNPDRCQSLAVQFPQVQPPANSLRLCD